MASDSGRALEARCEASTSWNRPERFLRVCPLLVPRTDGQCLCSVNAEEVRPFWGIALAYLGGGALLVALLAATLVYVSFRVIGFPIDFASIVWPPAWSDFDAARATYYAQRGDRALAENQFAEASLAYALAFDLNPGDYDTGRKLAQLWQTSQALLSDRVYERLLAAHPDRRSDTAEVWYRALLARGDFSTIVNLAAERLLVEPEHASAWTQALLFASRQLGDTASLRRSLAAGPTLPEEARFVLTFELDRRSETNDAQRQRALALLADRPGAYPAFHLLRTLTQLGFARETLTLLDRDALDIDDREKAALQLDAYAVLGWDTVRLQLAEALLARSLNTAVVEVLAVHLIEHPSPALLAALFRHVESAPLPLDEKNYPTYTALFAAAGAARDRTRIQFVVTRLRAVTGGKFAALQGAQTYFFDPKGNLPVERCLPALQPLPLAATYALYERTQARSSIPAKP